MKAESISESPSPLNPSSPLRRGGKGDFKKEGISSWGIAIETSLYAQKGNNLGERMYNAVQWLFDNGYQKVSLIGTDSPDLPLAFIKDAFQKLDSYKLVIGPSEDGGYYLIGMKNPFDMLFKNIEWGSDKVLKDTVSKAHSAGISYFLLPEWYDIDDLRSLSRWRLEIKESAHL